MKTRIHINQHNIRFNAKVTGDTPKKPVITAKDYKENRKGFTVRLLGPSKVVYSPDKPLPCGAKVWIETDEEVIVI